MPSERPNVHTVISRGREYYYFQIARGQAGAGPRIRITDPSSEQELQRALAASMARGWDKTLERCVVSAKTRAITGHLQFSIDKDFLFALLQRQEGKCAVSGIAFEHDGYTTCRCKPFTPSVDRIDPAQGYAKDNVRLVCLIANFAMSDWGLAALERLASALVDKAKL